jgi:WD40 repeat protein
LTGKEVAASEDTEKLRQAARSSASETLSPDGKIRASFGSDSVRLTGADSRLRIPSAIITAVAFSPSSKTLAGGYHSYSDGSGKVILWDVATAKALTTYKAHSGKVTCVAFSPDGKYLASAAADKKDELGEIKLWDPRTGQDFAFLQDSSVVVRVAFSPDGKILASANRDSTIKLWATEVLLSARNRPE